MQSQQCFLIVILTEFAVVSALVSVPIIIKRLNKKRFNHYLNKAIKELDEQ